MRSAELNADLRLPTHSGDVALRADRERRRGRKVGSELCRPRKQEAIPEGAPFKRHLGGGRGSSTAFGISAAGSESSLLSAHAG
jgi:hypothetical protein